MWGYQNEGHFALENKWCTCEFFWNFKNMVKVWFMDSDETLDQRLEHHISPPEFLTLEELFETTGVEYFKLNDKTYGTDGILENIRKERGYTYEDEIICSKECLPDYENTLRIFFTEHLHNDDEIRFVLDGSGYFDMRNGDNKWIRIAAVPGDMIIIPRGLYHRFTLDINNFIKARRYFNGDPIWTAYNRDEVGTEKMQCRCEYVEQLKKGFKIQ